MKCPEPNEESASPVDAAVTTAYAIQAAEAAAEERIELTVSETAVEVSIEDTTNRDLIAWGMILVAAIVMTYIFKKYQKD